MPYTSIAISGLPGSGKSNLAKKLSEELGWTFYSIGDLWRERHKKANPAVPFEVYWRSTSLEDNLQVNDDLLKIVEKGNIVADTRYVHIFGAGTCKIFINVPLEVRARRANNTGKYAGTSLDGIKTILLNREKDEVKMGKTLWSPDHDYRDERHYDVILNGSDFSVKEECANVLDYIHKA